MNHTSPVYLGNNRAICRTIYNDKMIVDTTDISLSPHILLDGYWEKWVTEFILKIIKPDMNILEVGSNIGYYTVLMGKRTKGKVFAFEANPRMFEILKQNIVINGLSNTVVPYNLAATSKKGNIELNVIKEYQGSSSIHQFDKSKNDYTTITVETDTVDNLITDRIDLVKIDAEGSEPLIIDGMMNAIQKNPRLQMIMEFNRALIEKTVDPYKFIDRLMEIGFEISYIDTNSKLHKFKRQAIQQTDIIELYLKRR
jgi:FkbM family methyltransferase